MQQVERTKNDCKAIGTSFCGYVGSEGCETCPVNTANMKEDVEGMVSNWEVTSHYIPEDTDEFHCSEWCQFSKSNSEKATSYAMLDLIHPEPKHMRGMFFGFGKKVRSSVGSMIQLPIPICEKAKRYFRAKEFVKWGIVTAFVIIGIVAMMLIASISDSEDSVDLFIGMGAFVVIVVAGVMVARLHSKNYTKRHESEFFVDAREIPLIKNMIERGWEPFHMDPVGTPLLFFAKQKPKPHLLFKCKAQNEVKKAEENEWVSMDI